MQYPQAGFTWGAYASQLNTKACPSLRRSALPPNISRRLGDEKPLLHTSPGLTVFCAASPWDDGTCRIPQATIETLDMKIVSKFGVPCRVWGVNRSNAIRVESLRINVWESTKPGNDRIGQSNTTYIENQRKTLFVDHSIMPPKIRRCSMFFPSPGVFTNNFLQQTPQCPACHSLPKSLATLLEDAYHHICI